jgi:hypothetical protein
VGNLLVLAAVVYFVVIRGWQKKQQLTNDGMLVIAFMTMYWQEMLASYFRPLFTYSTAFYQWGSWANFYPTMLMPRSQFIAQPILWEWSNYGFVVIGGAVVGCVVMTRAKIRWPALGKVGLAATCFAVLGTLDLLMELAWLRVGLYAYPQTIGWLTLFRGHTYQFPILEAVLWGATWTVFACLRKFVDGRSHMFSDRGIEELKVSTRRRTGIRLLAVIGIVNSIFFTYNVLCALSTLHAGPWPTSIVNQSYMTDNLCGGQTGISCTNLTTPVPKSP